MRRTLIVLPIIAVMLAGIFFAVRPFAQAGDQKDIDDHQAPELRPIQEDVQSTSGRLVTTRDAKELSIMQQDLENKTGHVFEPDNEYSGVLATNLERADNLKVVNATIGSDVSVPITLTLQPYSEFLGSVVVRAVAVDGEYIPAAFAKSATDEERTQERILTGKVSGALELGSTLSFSPSEVELKPNESTQIVAKVTIPSDWPKEAIGEEIPYQIFLVSYDKTQA